jgi:hypothetical protein
MNKNYLYLSIIIISLYGLFTTLYIYKEINGKKNEVILEIGATKISRGKIEEKLNQDFWIQAANSIADRTLILEEAKTLEIIPTKEQIEKEALFIRSTEIPTLDLNIPENLEYIKYRILVKELVRKYTLEEHKLTEEVSSSHSSVSHSFKALVYKGEHNIADKVIDSFNNQLGKEHIEKSIISN